jgi:hypothetical protein
VADGEGARDIVGQPSQRTGLAAVRISCDNGRVAEKKAQKKHYVDNGWPKHDGDEHAVSELAADRTGALSPFGDVTFPLPAEELPFVHAVTVVNK